MLRVTALNDSPAIDFSINLLAFYHKCCSLIGYATIYSVIVSSVVLCAFNKITAIYWHFLTVFEEDSFKLTSRFILKQLDYSLSISIAR